MASEVARSIDARLMYWRPAILPLAGRWLGRTLPQGVNSQPHSLRANRSLKQLIRLSYYALDYVVGYLLVIQPGRKRGRSFVIERGWWDMVVDWKRYGLRGPGAARALSVVIAKPDIVFIVSAPAEVVRERKPELESEEIVRQYVEWKKLDWPHTALVVLDNDRPLQETVREVMEHLSAQ